MATQIVAFLACLAIAGVLMFVNMKVGYAWLRLLTFVGMIAFLVLAIVVALVSLILPAL